MTVSLKERGRKIYADGITTIYGLRNRVAEFPGWEREDVIAGWREARDADEAVRVKRMLNHNPFEK